jgi:hypothetical protein
MEFDKSKVYTSVNADELKVGSKVICADNLYALKFCVEEEIYMTTIKEVMSEDCMLRFRTKEGEYALAYLISESEEKKLKVSDLKLGDIVRHKSGSLEYLVTGIDHSGNEVFLDGWIGESELKNWDKVEK